VRIIWVFTGAYWQSVFSRAKTAAVRGEDVNDSDTWKNVLIVAWTGTRGIISLATALALPLTMENGDAFPKRHSIIFLAFIVIFVTLVVQGLSLPLLIRLLRVKPQRNHDGEEKELKLYLASSTLHYIDNDFPISLESALREQLKRKYETLVNNLTKEIRADKTRRTDDESIQAPVTPLLNAQVEVSRFQRELLIKLHKEGTFSDDALRQVELERDVDDLKLDMQLPKEE
jgi:NhaP-type Na+/H+ or K+/H+ antiporter